VEVVGGVEDLVAGLFLRRDGGVKFAGCDLFCGGVDEAELAGGEVDFAVVAFAAHGWAEGAAENGTVFVEVAGAGGEVEDGAGLVVGEFFEEDGGFVVFVEDAGGEVAGKPWVEASEGVGYSCVDAFGRRLRVRWGRRRCSIESSRGGRRGDGLRVGRRRLRLRLRFGRVVSGEAWFDYSWVLLR
jgi:hypothetical protein